jgi:hypothetical protein
MGCNSGRLRHALVCLLTGDGIHGIDVIVLLTGLVLVAETLYHISSIIKLVSHKVPLPIIEFGKVFVVVHVVLGVQLVETLETLLQQEPDGSVVGHHQARHSVCTLHIRGLLGQRNLQEQQPICTAILSLFRSADIQWQ